MNRISALAILFTVGLVAATWTRSWAESPKPRHRVVFELTSDDGQAWDAMFNNVENVQKALGPVSIEVVAHGKGLAMLVSAKSAPIQTRLQHAAGAGVVFAACENTMKKQGVEKAQLVPAATTVDSGVAEVVRKQEAGWAYVRSGS